MPVKRSKELVNFHMQLEGKTIRLLSVLHINREGPAYESILKKKNICRIPSSHNQSSLTYEQDNIYFFT